LQDQKQLLLLLLCARGVCSKRGPYWVACVCSPHALMLVARLPRVVKRWPLEPRGQSMNCGGSGVADTLLDTLSGLRSLVGR
jgi:hypothetical protein